MFLKNNLQEERVFVSLPVAAALFGPCSGFSQQLPVSRLGGMWCGGGERTEQIIHLGKHILLRCTHNWISCGFLGIVPLFSQVYRAQDKENTVFPTDCTKSLKTCLCEAEAKGLVTEWQAGPALLPVCEGTPWKSKPRHFQSRFASSVFRLWPIFLLCVLILKHPDHCYIRGRGSIVYFFF